MTKTFSLTEIDAIEVQSAVFSQLVDVRRAVAEGKGSFEQLVRLEVLFERLCETRVKFVNSQKVGA